MLHERKAGPADYIIPGTIILVGDAETSYSDQIFWNDIIEELIQGRFPADIKLCLFSSYGNPSTGVESDCYSPAMLGPHRRVALTIQPKGPPLALFFNKAEAYKVMDKFITYDHPYIIATFDNDAKDYLFSLTNGHPCAITDLVCFIVIKRYSSIKHGLTILTKDMILENMGIEGSELDFYNYLKFKSYLRFSLPTGRDMTEGARETLACVLEKGNIPHEETYKDLDHCYRQSWLYKTVKEDGTVVYVLPSRLHEKWVEYLIGEEMRPLPSQFQTLRQLVMPILKGFSSTNLKNSFEGKILSSAASYRPVEAQYHDEFYRVFNKVAGRGVPIRSEWSRTRQGRIDFWIQEKKWAIELLRDHNQIDEHIARFYRDGKYYNQIKEGIIQDWIIVSCAISMPNKVFPEPRLIHAIFDPDYMGVRLLDNRLNLLSQHILTN
ncbi:hypothetical protein BJX63DRAFT_313624 [Aspergillus granulosus]|uniref:Uncharacterized protein n=1 Tax=Aspergillus granulosus TaxID=176169 RepID=A0ABR4HYG3_9EURO